MTRDELARIIDKRIRDCIDVCITEAARYAASQITLALVPSDSERRGEPQPPPDDGGFLT